MSTTTKPVDPAIVRVDNVRASFVHVFEAKAFDTGKPKFSIVLLLHKKKNAADIKKIDAANEFVKKDKWKGKPVKLLSEAYREGSEKADLDGYGDDVVFITASNEKRPNVVGRDLTPLSMEDGKPYSGCYVNASIRLWAQDNKYGKRVNASLRTVQFFKDGEPFGEKPADVESEFENLGEDDVV